MSICVSGGCVCVYRFPVGPSAATTVSMYQISNGGTYEQSKREYEGEWNRKTNSYHYCYYESDIVRVRVLLGMRLQNQCSADGFERRCNLIRVDGDFICKIMISYLKRKLVADDSIFFIFRMQIRKSAAIAHFAPERFAFGIGYIRKTFIYILAPIQYRRVSIFFFFICLIIFPSAPVIYLYTFSYSLSDPPHNQSTEALWRQIRPRRKKQLSKQHNCELSDPTDGQSCK